MMCKECNNWKVNAPRGLCRKCYDDESIRSKYPALSRQECLLCRRDRGGEPTGKPRKRCVKRRQWYKRVTQPPLTAEQLELFERWMPDIGNIIRSNTLSLWALVNQYPSFEDAHQQAMFGLLEASRLWREDGGASFFTYLTMRLRRTLQSGLAQGCGRAVVYHPYKSKIEKRRVFNSGGFQTNDADEFNPFAVMPDPAVSHTDVIEQRDAVDSALTWMSPKEREAVRDCYLAGLTLRECGARREVSKEAVRRRLELGFARARKHKPKWVEDQMIHGTLKVSEVAKALGSSSRYVTNLCDKGMLKFYRLPGKHAHRRVMRDDLIEFMKAHGIPESRLGEYAA